MTLKKTAADKRANLPRAVDYTSAFLKDWQRLSRSGRYDMRRLKEAMALAQANEQQTTSNAGNFVTPYQDDFLYLRGRRVLKAELAELENRSNNDTFISELPHLLEHKQLLESIELSANQIGVAQVDFPAVTPVLPIKPKKALILALSVVLGGMLGGMIVLGRGFYGKQK